MQLPIQAPVHAVRLAFGFLKEPHVYWPVVIVIGGVLSRWWSQVQRRIKERKARQWPALSAVVDVVSVVERVIKDEHRVYVATLTYFYRNPALQMGEFERQFRTRPAAKSWVEQFKGRLVMIHVNPADLTDSILLESDLAGLEQHRPAPSAGAQLGALPDDSAEAMAPGYRLLCGIGELLSLSGLAASAVMLLMSLSSGGHVRPTPFYWMGGALLATSLVSALAIWMHLRRSEAGRELLKTYSQWAPGWLRWSLKGTSAFFALIWPFFHLFRGTIEPLVAPWVKLLGPHFVYLAGVWIFLLITAFLAAVLRSQEEIRVPVLGA